MERAQSHRTQSERALLVSVLSVASVLFCWVLLYFAEDRFWPLVNFTAALGGMESVGLLIYLVVYVIKLFGGTEDRTRGFLGLLSIFSAALITSAMGLLALIAYL